MDFLETEKISNVDERFVIHFVLGRIRNKIPSTFFRR